MLYGQPDAADNQAGQGDLPRRRVSCRRRQTMTLVMQRRAAFRRRIESDRVSGQVRGVAAAAVVLRQEGTLKIGRRVFRFRQRVADAIEERVATPAIERHRQAAEPGLAKGRVLEDGCGGIGLAVDVRRAAARSEIGEHRVVVNRPKLLEPAGVDETHR